MHSSRMHTARSSNHGGSPHPMARSPSTSPLGVGLEQIPLNFPLGCGPGPDPPKFSPFGVGLDLIPPQFSPLGVGLDLIPPQFFPLGVGLDLIPSQFSPWVWAWT